MMVVALGALQNIPGDLYEAASIDGASHGNPFDTSPSHCSSRLGRIIIGKWTFNISTWLPRQSGAPGALRTFWLRGVSMGVREERYGYAAAYSIVIFIVLVSCWFTQRVGGATDKAS